MNFLLPVLAPSKSAFRYKWLSLSEADALISLFAALLCLYYGRPEQAYTQVGEGFKSAMGSNTLLPFKQISRRLLLIRSGG